MTKQFNVHVIVKAPDYNKAVNVWAKIKAFLKKEFGEEAITLEFLDNQLQYDKMFHGEVFLYLTEPKAEGG
jgi:hypothetical protein